MVDDSLRTRIQRATGTSVPVVSNAVDFRKLSAYAGQQNTANVQHSIYDGSKFYGGFGDTQLQQVDYWTLRQRSSEIFNTNLYGRGLIRRLITNEVGPGLSPESRPEEKIIGVAEDSLADFSEFVENRFAIWGKAAFVCDWKRVSTFGELQRTIRRESLVSGDILIVLRNNAVTNTPMIQLIKGDKIKTPSQNNKPNVNKNKITHGVEKDNQDRVVAYWVQQDDLSFKRIATKGTRSNRTIAWLEFGTDKRMDDVRGQPLLSIVLQSLKEVDRYRDSTQRKAVINSLVAMSVEKSEEKMGSLPLQGAASRRDSKQIEDGDGTIRTFNASSMLPGVTLDELQVGETLNMHGGQGTDLNFPGFEQAIISAIAWANEIPPEILTLSFNSNYSASQAAINEFKIYLNLFWTGFGERVCSPIFNEWFLSEVLNGKIDAPGFLDAWRDPRKYDIHGAWLTTHWYGSIKPSTDMLKQGRGSKLLVENGWSTNARESRITTGTKFSKNVKQLKRENEMLAEAMRPLMQVQQEFPQAEAGKSMALSNNNEFDFIDFIDAMDEYLAENNINVE